MLVNFAILGIVISSGSSVSSLCIFVYLCDTAIAQRTTEVNTKFLKEKIEIMIENELSKKIIGLLFNFQTTILKNGIKRIIN